MEKETRRLVGKVVHSLAVEAHHAIDRAEEFFQQAIEAENCGEVARAAELFVRAMGEEALALGKMFAVGEHSRALNGRETEVEDE